MPKTNVPQWQVMEAKGLVRAKSEHQLTESEAAAAATTGLAKLHPTWHEWQGVDHSGNLGGQGAGGVEFFSGNLGLGGGAGVDHSGTLSTKSGGRTHVKKSRSTQLRNEDDVSSAALSRASSVSLGMSFSLTGFIMPTDDAVPDSKPFCEGEYDDIPEDLEAGVRTRIEAEPTMPISLKFTDVTYKVILKGAGPGKTEEKEILHGISGSVEPGEVLALMGPSGSGKTTLLNVLGGRLNHPTPGGLITYNDLPYSKFLKSRIGFVTQDDILFQHLTVRETLTYAAYLRLPKALTKKEKEKRALDVISELGLQRCQDTIIGGSFVRGVSGGERKRVSIGNEIIINPSLLLLDEPTSGLDSTTALRIIQMLQDIAEAGKTVITTIHQPSSRLFHKFDKLILLGKGSLLYYGKASDAMHYFSSIQCTPLIAMNPAEFLLDLANGNMNDVTIPSALEDKEQTGCTDHETAKGKPSPSLVHEYLVEAYETRLAEKEKKNIMMPIAMNEENQLKLNYGRREWGATWWEQYSILFWRGIKERKHDYFSWLRISQVLIIAVILGLLWWQSTDKTADGLQDQIGLLFFFGVFWGFLPVMTSIFTFSQERAMLKKERSADMYRLSAYFLARTSSDLPLDLLLPILFIVIVYFMAGLRLNAGTFFLTVLTVLLEIVAAQGFGLAIGASLMDVKKATTVASVTVMAFMLAGGFFVNKVPVFIAWLRYLSFNYHTYRLLLKVQYEHQPPSLRTMKINNGMAEVGGLMAMVFGYRLWAYIALRRMKLGS
ncbi:ABC transporter G family member 22-like protein [Drosera capensis]